MHGKKEEKREGDRRRENTKRGELIKNSYCRYTAFIVIIIIRFSSNYTVAHTSIMLMLMLIPGQYMHQAVEKIFIYKVVYWCIYPWLDTIMLWCHICIHTTYIHTALIAIFGFIVLTSTCPVVVVSVSANSPRYGRIYTAIVQVLVHAMAVQKTDRGTDGRLCPN